MILNLIALFVYDMHRLDLEEWADVYFGGECGLSKRKTFSCPSYYRGKKMVAFLYHDALGIKLPPERVLQKIAEDSEVYSHFNPGDGIMKNWLLITRPDASEYEQEKYLIEESLNLFV